MPEIGGDHDIGAGQLLALSFNDPVKAHIVFECVGAHNVVTARGDGPTQLTATVWSRPVSEAAGSQRHERAGWNGPAPLPPWLAAGSNALAPLGGVKAAIRPVTALRLPGGERIVGPHQPNLLANDRRRHQKLSPLIGRA